jgi:hypothetical protein
MNNVIKLCAILTVAALLAGCSKKTEGGGLEVVPATNEQAVAASAAPQTGGAVAKLNSLPEVSRAIQSGQYVSAVDTLTQMKQMTPQMTDAQRLQYQQAVRDAATALLAVREKDPAARAAYQKLSQSATGR